MKKLGFLLALCMALAPLFSQNRNGWSSFGLSVGNQWETSGEEEIKAYMLLFGIDLSSYMFKNDKGIGFWTNTIFSFPSHGTLEYNGIKETVDYSSYDFIIFMDSYLGPGFKIGFNERILLNYGLGPHIGLGFATSENTRLFSFLLGIGGDIGVKFGITDLLSISLGSKIAYDFLCYTIGSNSFVGSVSGLAKNYSLIQIKPYICLSLSKYTDSNNKGHWGKMKE
jgi:hypothetical protein